MKPVTDPNTLAALEGGQPQGPRAVRDPAVLAQLDYGLDFTAPKEDIRAKIETLPATEHDRAYSIWGDYQVQQERAAGFKPGPSPVKGIPIIGPYLDEASAGIQGAIHSVFPNSVVRPYDEALAVNRARDRASEADAPVTAAVGRLATGLATGGPLLSRLPLASTLTGRVVQGAGIGAGIGAVEGFGHGEGGNRMQTAADTAFFGGVLGAGLPVAAAAATRGIGAARDYLNPTLVRLREGPEEAADEILARSIYREGSTPGQKRLDLQRGQAVASRLDSNSRATLPETIADTSDAMQRLTGSVYRSGGEPGNFVRGTLQARQRGPENPFAPRATDAPDGQIERVMDATERALLLRTSNSARRTERQIMRQQAEEGRRLYREAYDKSEEFDIQPAIDGMMLTAQQYSGPFRRTLLRAVDLFRRPNPTNSRWNIDNVRRFDGAKKQLDDMIETARRQGEGNLARELTSFKDNLLSRVHAVDDAGTPTINLGYREARQAWGSAAENREAIELGRAALRESSEVSVEQFRELSRGQQQLFRIGFLDSLRNALGTKRPGNDVTQLFQQRRVRELMNEIIPRSSGRNSVFANRPERYGEVLRREQRMTQTNNAVLGNSLTAQRHQDDLQFAGDALSGMWNRFRQSPSLFNMGVEAIGVGIQRIFGYRQDVAGALARRLLESDPTTRNQILRRLARRGGPGPFGRFAEMIDRSSNALIGAGVQPVAIEDQR